MTKTLPKAWLACGAATMVLLLGVGRGMAAEAALAAKAKKALIVTGEDIGAHRWRETAPAVKELLAKDARLEVTVVTDLKFLCSPELKQYDVVVLHFKNADAKTPGPAAHKNLAEYVRGGGGLVLLHFACGAFQEWPEFVQIAGRVWDPKLRGHDPYGKFQVDIADPDHPIVKGLKPFETQDELYTCLDGQPPIKLLATAVSKVDQKTYPMAFVFECGKGRVFHCVLGHDLKAFAAPEVGELLRRGTSWAAVLPPTAQP